MKHTKGELHQHELTIHIEEKVNGKVVNHTCIANMNPVHTAYTSTNEERKRDAAHIILCWNNHDALLASCQKLTNIAEVVGHCVGKWTTEHQALAQEYAAEGREAIFKAEHK